MAVPEIYVPDPEKRPGLVVWAYRCWLVSGTMMALIGVLCLGIGAFGGGDGAGMAIGIGVLLLGVGGAYIFLGRNAYLGDARWRSSLALLTLVVVAMLIFGSVGLVSPLLAVAMIFAVIGLFGSLLAYRIESDEWYTGTRPEPKKAAPKRKPKR